MNFPKDSIKSFSLPSLLQNEGTHHTVQLSQQSKILIITFEKISRRSTMAQSLDLPCSGLVQIQKILNFQKKEAKIKRVLKLN